MSSRLVIFPCALALTFAGAAACRSQSVPPLPPSVSGPTVRVVSKSTNANSLLSDPTAPKRTPAPAPPPFYLTPPPVTPTAVPGPAPQIMQAPAVLPNPALNGAPGLAFDAKSKEQKAKPGETLVHLSFSVTNVAKSDVLINAVRTSCGCTAAKLPSLPWRLAPGASGPIEVDVDIRGKRGVVSKLVSLDTSVGPQLLTVRVNIPEAEDSRTRNMMLALADRQAVFRNDCATCHVHPAAGKKGKELFHAMCGVCHEAEHRASMVPDLKAVKTEQTPEYWKSWIVLGKPGSLMPAFAQSEGGPLTEEQVQSLVDFLSQEFPREAGKTAAPSPGPTSPTVLAPAAPPTQ